MDKSSAIIWRSASFGSKKYIIRTHLRWVVQKLTNTNPKLRDDQSLNFCYIRILFFAIVLWSLGLVDAKTEGQFNIT